jgi:hypothetical protein
MTRVAWMLAAGVAVVGLGGPAAAQYYDPYSPPRSSTYGPGYETHRSGNRSVTRQSGSTTYREGNRSVTVAADGTRTERWNTPCGPASRTISPYGGVTVRGGC